MTDRDRLIELFKEMDKDFGITCPNINTDKNCKGCKYQIRGAFIDCNYLERKVDYLLANGVIVPPCKVGDTIYKNILFKDGHGDTVPQSVVGFHLGKFPHIRGRERKQYIIVYHEVVNTISHIDIKQIGKTVFLTKEEAEQKLKELKENA
jgi:hypothetical protein